MTTLSTRPAEVATPAQLTDGFRLVVDALELNRGDETDRTGSDIPRLALDLGPQRVIRRWRRANQ